MDTEQAREHLEQERIRLGAIQEEMAANQNESESESLSELSSLDQHPADLGTETFNRERDLSILDSVEAELTDIEHAMARIEDGTYGICESCGKAIGADRLNAMPAARFCLEDQGRAEQEAHIPASNSES